MKRLGVVQTYVNGRHRGNSLVRDLKCWLPRTDITVILDVGANRGDCSLEFSRAWPRARVIAIEPFEETCEVLKERVKGRRNVEVHRLALGKMPGVARLSVPDPDDHSRNQLIHGDESPVLDAVSGGLVEVRTLDCFMDAIEVQRVGLLKIDTEGRDLEVLEGGEAALRRGAVDVVQVEVAMNPDNELHVPLGRFQEFLEGFGFRLFALYEQVNAWPTREPHLRRCDAVFISGSTIGRNASAGTA